MEQYRNTALYVEKARLLLEAGEQVPLPVQGGSMAPFLVNRRDQVWLEKPEPPIRVGDMLLYQRESGQYILHRVSRIRPDGEMTMIGDAHSVREPGIRPGQVLGRVVRVCRKGKLLEPGSFVWEFFAKVWIRMIPVRRPVMKMVTGIRKLFRRKQ